MFVRGSAVFGIGRHADVNRNAVMIAKIATVEIEDKLTGDGKTPPLSRWGVWAERPARKA